MKKFDITVSLGIIILCVLLMILVGLRSCDRGGAAPSYRFLDGRNPITCKIANRGTEDSRGIEDRRYIYSFEADFNDLCSKADAELIPADFTSEILVTEIPNGNNLTIRSYYLKGRFSCGPMSIQVYNNIQYIVLPDSNKGASCVKDGWVMVEVIYFQGWRWPF